MADRARTAAYEAVKRILAGAYSNLVSFKGDLDGVDRAFAENVAVGTVERKITLEYIVDPLLRSATKPDLKALLLTGAYQIFYLDRVPDHAAVDETVKIAYEFFGRNGAGFVNAVMRTLVREKDGISVSLANAPGYVRASADAGLYAMIKEQYPEKADDIFASFFGRSDTFLRVNTLKTSAAELASASGGRVVSNRTVTVGSAADALDSVENGDCIIQGAGSQRAVEWLCAKKGDTVVDVCACPGGKSLGAAMDMENEGKIYSFDIHENKLGLISKSAKKLGISIISPAVCDARVGMSEVFGKADGVICDVPCSGTGVMGAKPEIKYKSPESFAGLYKTQREIIARSAEYLKPGGTMIYSTCSINKTENEETVEAFLETNKGFRLAEMSTSLPCDCNGEGFFTAKLIRENR